MLQERQRTSTSMVHRTLHSLDHNTLMFWAFFMLIAFNNREAAILDQFCCLLVIPKQSIQTACINAHLLGWDIDVGNAVVLAHDWDVGQHIDGRDVSRKNADPVTCNTDR